jgi:hypothetical protein
MTLKVDFGGGIRSRNDLKTAFDCGASQVSCGSVAVKDPAMFLEWLEEWGLHPYFLAEKLGGSGILSVITAKPGISSPRIPGWLVIRLACCRIIR